MKERKFIRALCALVAVGLLMVGYGNWLIHSAELVSVDNNGYQISFNGQIHEYTYAED